MFVRAVGDLSAGVVGDAILDTGVGEARRETGVGFFKADIEKERRKEKRKKEEEGKEERAGKEGEEKIRH